MNLGLLLRELPLRQLRGQPLIDDGDVHLLLSRPQAVHCPETRQSLQAWTTNPTLSPQARLALLRLLILSLPPTEQPDSRALSLLSAIPLRHLSANQTLSSAPVRALVWLLADWPWDGKVITEHYRRAEDALHGRTQLSALWPEPLTPEQRRRLENFCEQL